MAVTYEIEVTFAGRRFVVHACGRHVAAWSAGIFVASCSRCEVRAVPGSSSFGSEGGDR